MHTHDFVQGAVHLNHFFRRVSGLLVQPVYVLSDESVQLSTPIELNKRVVSGVWPGLPRRMIQAALPR